VTGNDDEGSRLWNTATANLIAKLDGTIALKGFYRLRQDVTVFSPDSSTLVTVRGRETMVWEAVTGRLRFTLMGHKGEVCAVAFSPNGRDLATASEDGTVRIWETKTGFEKFVLPVWRVKKISSFRIISRALHVPVQIYVMFSPDGRSLLTNTYWEDSAAKLWDVETGRLIREFGSYTIRAGLYTKTAGVTSASFSPDGKWIVTNGLEVVKLWETKSGQLMYDRVLDFSEATFSPDSKLLVVVGAGRVVVMLNLETLKFRQTPSVNTSFANQVAFSPDSRKYVIGSGYKDYHATVIDAETGRVEARIPLAARWGFDFVSDYLKDVDLLYFHPSRQILMGANHKSVRLWDATTGQLMVKTFEGRDPASFSTDGSLLVTVAADKKRLLLWDVAIDLYPKNSSTKQDCLVYTVTRQSCISP
jgi:WD40 repeat protein